MAELNGLPVYKMKPGLGVDFHSLVSDPAIEVLYKTFSKDTRYKFNQEKQIITGPFMIPDLPIFRSDATHGDYYVVFEKSTIQELNEMFMKEQKTLSFNYQHLENSKVEGAVLVENWIVAEGDNKAKNLGFDVPVGTWMGSVKINNKEFWDKEIKSGNAKGFSIEGYLDMQMSKIKKHNMKKTFAVTAKTKEGKSLGTEAEAFAEGVEIYEVAEDGTQMPAPDGVYIMEDGSTITCAGGKITSIENTGEEVLSTDEIEALMKALAPQFQKAIEAATAPLLKEVAEIKEKFSKLPGAASVTAKTDPPANGKMSLKEKISARMDKINEFKTHKTK